MFAQRFELTNIQNTFPPPLFLLLPKLDISEVTIPVCVPVEALEIISAMA
jgi:hypothetical protein